MIKKLLTLLLLSAAVILINVSALADNVYYQNISSETLSKNLTYEKQQLVTDAGFLDVYVLRVPLADANITVSPVNSVQEFGLKQPTADLLSEAGAVAGINGDFFGMSGRYSIPLGFEAANGQITSAGSAQNVQKEENATFLIDNAGNPFIEYLKTSVAFLYNGIENMLVGNFNKTADAVYPTIITADAVKKVNENGEKTTAEIDARIPNTFKIKVSQGKITYISEKGQTVAIPQDGYVVLMNEQTAKDYLSKFAVGQTAEIKIQTSVDYSKINSAITGAGKLLSGGVIANDTGFISAGRAPRTALGYNKEKDTLILMVVDGRGHSIGASHQNMADLMLKAGAYDAMHLDGGGSSTIVTNGNVMNAPSDGAARSVINALGVFVNAQAGQVSSLKVETDAASVIHGTPVNVYVTGFDEYMNKVPLDFTKISLFAESNAGIFDGEKFFPNIVGEITLYASYAAESGTISGQTTIVSERLAVMTASKSKIQTEIAVPVTISYKGTGGEGYSVAIDASSLSYEVFPTELGFVENGVFTAQTLGQGYIKATHNDAGNITECITTVYVNLVEKPLDGLTGYYKARFMSYPETVKGHASYDGGISGATLSYSFEKSASTQATYFVFDDGIVIPEKTQMLRLGIYGDNSQNWLRGRVTDSAGTEYAIDFVRNINFDGLKYADAKISLPATAVYPVKLTRIYVTSISQDAPITSELTFTDLKAIVETDLGLPAVQTPPPVQNIDLMNVEFYYGELPADAKDFTFSGSKGTIIYGEYIANYGQNNKIPTISSNELFIVQPNTVAGGLFSGGAWQWGQIEQLVSSGVPESAAAVVIQTETSPLHFADKQEGEMLHKIFANIVKSGKKIFVISNEAAGTAIVLKDGVRYINLQKFDDPLINPTVMIRIQNGTIKYQVKTD
ncbi:MAG: phosphodiester glycosidase family protein [Clostridiales bacterium]|jgi:exopolysaccharide biosynthesis protein|nr:phosphodiester glycosidase family protein [Clostridiales bacterium]